MSKLVVAITDERDSYNLVRNVLRGVGLRVEGFSACPESIQRALGRPATLVLLGPGPWALKTSTLHEFLSRPHRASLLVVTARPAQESVLQFLALGIDDFIVKPFSLDELMVRVTLLLNRVKRSPTKVRLGRTVVDLERYEAFRGSRPIEFTDREFELLRYLAERGGEVVSREDLFRRVWGHEKTPTRTVDHFVFRLRRKIEVDPHHPRFLRTAYGKGYRLLVGPKDLSQQQTSESSTVPTPVQATLADAEELGPREPEPAYAQCSSMLENASIGRPR